MHEPSIDGECRVRRFDVRDLAQCARILLEARREAFHWESRGEQRLEDFERRVEDEVIFVIERGGRVLGFLSIDWAARFLHNMYIDPAFQGQGLGRRLLERALAHMGPPVDLKTRPENVASQAFYRRLGWFEVERVEEGWGPFVRMRWEGPSVGDA